MRPKKRIRHEARLEENIKGWNEKIEEHLSAKEITKRRPCKMKGKEMEMIRER